MKVHQMLICIFILSLQDGNTGLTNAQTVITGKEGGNITQGCKLIIPGSLKTFCMEECEDKDILVETTAPFMLKPTQTLPPPLTSVASASTQTPSAAATGVLLCVRLTLVVIFMVSSAAVLIFCRRRASKAEDPPVEAEYVNVTEANPVHEELGEDRRSRSPPEEISAGHNLSCSQFAEDSV